MKTTIIILAFVLVTCAAATGNFSTSHKLAITAVDTSRIPENLEECFTRMDKLLPEKNRQPLLALAEKQFTAQLHFGLGTWMRNNWGLWSGRSNLAKYFKKMGIYHPEDMSGIILTSYYRRSKGKDIMLDEQIKHYQNYWKVVQYPSEDSFPAGVKGLELNEGIYYDSKTNGQGFVRIGRLQESDDVWLYDFYLGWAKVTGEDVYELGKCKEEDRKYLLTEIYKRARYPPKP